MKTMNYIYLVPLAIACATNPVQDGERSEPVGNFPDSMDFIAVESGTFEMGSSVFDADRAEDELLHTVVLTNDFEMTRTEITVEQFESYAGYNPVQQNVTCVDCPVQNVSWHEAAAFTNAMSEFHAVESCYTCEGDGVDVQCDLAMDPYICEGYRIPTEAEWEYAADAGQNFEYPGSDNPSDVGWFFDNSDHHTEPVGLLMANAWGFVDMGGNVREFVNDWYSDYSPGSVTNPYTGVVEWGHPVERGASYDCIPRHMRVVTRYFHMNSDTVHPNNGAGYDREYVRDAHVGFRIVRGL